MIALKIKSCGMITVTSDAKKARVSASKASFYGMRVSLAWLNTLRLSLLCLHEERDKQPFNLVTL